MKAYPAGYHNCLVSKPDKGMDLFSEPQERDEIGDW